jgi:hypothetical protein
MANDKVNEKELHIGTNKTIVRQPSSVSTIKYPLLGRVPIYNNMQQWELCFLCCPWRIYITRVTDGNITVCSAVAARYNNFYSEIADKHAETSDPLSTSVTTLLQELCRNDNQRS